MKSTFVEKHLDVSTAVKEYAEKKMSKLEKYFHKESTAQTTFCKEGDGYEIEITVSCDGLFYRSSVVGSDMYSIIDAVISHIERQIHKHKTRLEKRLKKGAFEKEIPPTIMTNTDVEEEMDFDIIRTKSFELKPMTTEEAILQMNLLQHTFFCFKNFSNRSQFAVVYRRKDGGYGLIEEN